MHSSLLIALAVPPMNLLLLCLLGLALAASGRYRRAGLGVLALGLAGLFALSLPAVSARLLVSLEHGLPLTPPADNPPGAIVILGGDVRLGAASLSDMTLGPLSLERLRAGAELQRRTGLPVLVSGGVIEQGLAPIATLMADSLAADFATKVRWQEPKAETTWENAAFSAAILKAAGIRSVYVVTHAWHMPRALLAFRHFGLTVTAAPTLMDRHPAFEASDLVPHASSWVMSYYALHEWIGLADYALGQ